MIAAGQANPDPWLFGLLFLFPIIWCVAVASIALVGGWHSLAKTYRAEDTTFRIASPEEGERFRWATLTMGPPWFPTNYGNCVTVTIGVEGIGLRVIPLFRVLHPPLLIPWEAIERCELDRIFLVYWRARVCLVDRPHPLCICGRAGKAVMAACELRGLAASAGE